MRVKFNNLLKKEIQKYKDQNINSDELYKDFKHHYHIYDFPFFQTIIDSKFNASTAIKVEILKEFYNKNDNSLIYYCLSELKQSVELAIINRYEIMLFLYLSRFGIEEIVNLLLSENFQKNIIPMERKNYGTISSVLLNISNIIENSVDRNSYVSQIKNIILDENKDIEVRIFYCHLLHYFEKEETRKYILNFYRQGNVNSNLIYFFQEHIDKEYISVYNDILLNYLVEYNYMDLGQFVKSMITIVHRHDNSKLEEIIKYNLKHNLNALRNREWVNIIVTALVYKLITLNQYYKYMSFAFVVFPEEVAVSVVDCMFSEYMSGTMHKDTKREKQEFLDYFYKVLENIKDSDIMDTIDRIILRNSIFYSKYMEDIYASTSP